MDHDQRQLTLIYLIFFPTVTLLDLGFVVSSLAPREERVRVAGGWMKLLPSYSAWKF